MGIVESTPGAGRSSFSSHFPGVRLNCQAEPIRLPDQGARLTTEPAAREAEASAVPVNPMIEAAELTTNSCICRRVPPSPPDPQLVAREVPSRLG